MNNKAEYYWNILNESSSSYIYILQSRYGHSFVVHVLILLLKAASEVSSLTEFRIRFQIFVANQKRVSLPLDTVVLCLCNIIVFIKVS